MILYKYLGPERLDTLERNLIRFTQAAALNDPFELRPFFKELIPPDYLYSRLDNTTIDIWPMIAKSYHGLPEEVRSRMTLEELHARVLQHSQSEEGMRELQETLRAALATTIETLRAMTPQISAAIWTSLTTKLGILSLSELPAHPLMWAHYAAEHRGFLIGFDSSSSFFHQRRSSDDECYHLRKVVYRETQPHPSLVTVHDDDILVSKATSWSYEQEWRMLAPIADATELIPAPTPIALYQFPASCVSEIVVGSRASRDLAERLNLILKSDSYSHVRQRSAELNFASGHIQIVP